VDEGAYGELAGRTIKQAQARTVELLRASGDLIGEPTAITHPVKFYENGDAPLEIVATRQWYVRNGGRDAALRDDLLERGRGLRWVPAHMRHRYEHWVGGLTGDWLISRQRYLGVPFPVWYRLDAEGRLDYEDPLAPAEDRLPVDPATEPPDGYDESQRGRPGGFVADPDVMDTWATSSLSPFIAAGWERDADLFARTFPMDLRPQSHEIIRTWLFSSVVRTRAEFGVLPWHTVVISGWILDPDRKKMSKSKGNALGPIELLDRYGSDALRYWAAGGRPGVDTALDESQMKIGRRLATKLLNASSFVLGLGATKPDDPVTEELDRSMLARLSTVVEVATGALEAYDHTAARDAIEAFFWEFCDDYIELVKERAYGEGAGGVSARSALRAALETQLRLFAPYLPFVTEEVWSWLYPATSVHRAAWPSGAVGDGDPEVLSAVGQALAQIRRAKSERRLSLRADVARATIAAPPSTLDLLASAQADLRAAGRIATLELVPADHELVVTCEW
jgi:valyl-tRNA synthetase